MIIVAEQPSSSRHNSVIRSLNLGWESRHTVALLLAGLYFTYRYINTHAAGLIETSSEATVAPPMPSATGEGNAKRALPPHRLGTEQPHRLLLTPRDARK
jgi:hypothetical protein